MEGMRAIDLPLRDIHLPPEPIWWPPAPGWILVIVVLIALGWATLLLYRLILRYRAHIQALAVLATIDQQRREAPQDVRWLVELSKLVRRHALSVHPQPDLAGMHGNAWRNFLTCTRGGARFGEDHGRWLVHGPYQVALEIPEVEARALIRTVRHWIPRQPPARKSC